MSQFSIWKISEIALLSSERRDIKRNKTLPMKQEGEIRARNKKEE